MRILDPTRQESKVVSMGTSVLDYASASEGTVAEVQHCIQKVLSTLAGDVPEQKLWDAAGDARDYVRQLLSDQPREARTGSAVVHYLGFVLGKLGLKQPLPEVDSEELRIQVDGILQGNGRSLRPPA